MRRALRRPLRFLVSGGAATGVHWVTMAALMMAGVVPAVATGAGAVAGAAANYPLQQRFTFGGAPRGEPIPLYILVCALGWAANLGLFVTLHDTLGLATDTAQVITTAAVAVLNYTLYKRWVFHDRSRFPVSGTAD